MFRLIRRLQTDASNDATARARRTRLGRERIRDKGRADSEPQRFVPRRERNSL